MTSARRRSGAALTSLLLFCVGATAVFDHAARRCLSCAFGQMAAPQSERELTGGGMHTYGLTLAAGQYVRAVFDQRGVDVEASLLDPDGRELLRVNNPSGSWGVDSIFFEAERGGRYTIVVGPAATSAPPGRYEFDIELGEVGTTDRRRLGAERSLARASSVPAGGTHNPATGRYEEALPLFRAASDRRGEMTALEIAGTVAAATGDTQKALAYFNELLALQRASKERRGEATTLSRAGQVFYSLGNKQKSLEYFDQALTLFRQSGDGRMAAYTLANVGLARAEMTDRRDAVDAFQNALALMRAVNDRRGEAFVLNQLGLLYDALGDRQQAHRHHGELVQLLRVSGNCQELAPALSNLAWSSLESDDKRKAIEYLNEALSIQRSIGDRRGEAATLNNLGFVFNSLGDRPKALAHLKQALTLSRELADKQGEGDASSNLMYLWKTGQKPGAAIFYGKMAVNAYQEVRAELPPLDLMAQRSFIKSKELTYNELADLLITQGRLLEAQQVIDLLKEQEYLDYVRRDGGNASSAKGGATLTTTETDAGKKYEALADQLVLRGRQRGELLAKQTRTPEEEQLLSKLETELQASGQAFQEFLDRLGEELGNTKQAARVDQLRDSQALMDDLRELGPGAVALYTLVGAEKYRVILITPHVQKAAEYPIKAEELERKVFALREALRNPRSDVRPLAEGMYRILFGPIAKDLKDAQAETLMWSLDGPLRYVPMAALHDGEKYVVERYRNVVFTPASNSRLKDVSSARWSGFGAGVTKQHANFSALPGVLEELHGIIREQDIETEGVLEGRVLLDDAFTLETLRAGLRQRFQVVHIASHFAVQPGNERDSFLLLGDGSRLSLSEIRSAVNLFGGVELLTLSACDTATGGTAADGREVESFAVLAQRQGAKAVLASLWPVADQSTKQLMQNFYSLRNAQPGAGKAEALRQAQLALLHGRADAPVAGEQSRGIQMSLRLPGSGGAAAAYSHPFFWAPFILIGNWR
jgi:CHAT domain-containing protein